MSKKPFIQQVSFVTSATGIKDSPKSDLPEYAFIGRSNVGKSSLINMLTQSKGLARVSVTPGKTQLINYFIVDDRWYLVDMPGYGYAKASKKQRFVLSKMIKQYITERLSLSCLFVLLDSRHAPMDSDMAFMRWLGENGIPFAMVFTKTDKLSKSQLQKSISVYRTEMNKDWEILPEMFFTSAKKLLGKEEILTFISKTNKTYKENERK